MKLFGRNIELKVSGTKETEIKEYNNYPYSYPSKYTGLPIPFDGEKTPYELGTPIDEFPDYYSLRVRSWSAFLRSDIVQNVIRKYILWVVGQGLKIQYDPVNLVLNEQGVNLSDEYTENIETKFRLFCNSKNSTYNKLTNLHVLASEALKNAIISGDVLIILRYNKSLTVELIDGVFIQTPIGSNYETEANKKGNIIFQGVEINKKGEHIAYYIADDNGGYNRILSRGSRTGRLQAWLMYGLKYKLNDTRGMSLLTAVIETANKMDRYKDATLNAAEENSNVIYSIKHGANSTGENPMVKEFVQSMGKNKGTAPETKTDCEQVASKIAQKTKGMAYNLPVDSEIDRTAYNVDPNYKSFYEVNIDLVYATLGIAPEVALDRFGGSYSSSRAALKGWEYKLMVDRKNIMSEEFYKPIFNYWFDINVFNQKIDAPGYLEFYQNKDDLLIEAYLNSRFIGRGVPHIDPSKEVNAIRSKLGKIFENVPLETLDQATEELNTGDFSTIIKKTNNEKNLASDFINNQSENS